MHVLIVFEMGPICNSQPIGSMYGIFTYIYIYHKNQPNVGKYTIHGSYGQYCDVLPLSFFVTTKIITFLIRDPNQNLHVPMRSIPECVLYIHVPRCSMGLEYLPTFTINLRQM